MKLLIISIMLNITLFAHPHFFIDVDINIDKNKITYFWTFDRLNSKLLSFEFDENKDKLFQKKEQDRFYKTHIVITKENNFNLFLESNKKEYIFGKIENYELYLKNKKVVFTFSQEIESIKNMTLCSIDPTVYMAFKLQNIQSNYNLNIQKSQYDFCIGVQ